MSTKPFRLSASDAKPLAQGFGGCFASDHILVDGMRVGLMYREPPDNTLDSGWRFMSGKEDDEYLSESDHLGFYDVNTIANYDPSIVPLLTEPIGSAFAKPEGSTSFAKVENWAPGSE